MSVSKRRVPKEKISDKMIKSVEDRVTTIKRELGHVHFKEIEEALKTGFAKALDIRLVDGQLNRTEKSLALKLKKEKYSTVNWTFHRPQ